MNTILGSSLKESVLFRNLSGPLLKHIIKSIKNTEPQ